VSVTVDIRILTSAEFVCLLGNTFDLLFVSLKTLWRMTLLRSCKVRMVSFNGRGSDKGWPNRKARPKKDKIHHYPHSMKTKILIVQEAYEAERCIKPVVRKHQVALDSIKQWKCNLVNLKAKALINPNAKTAHLGATVKDAHIESQLKTWILQQHKQNLLVRTQDIVYHAIQISPNFKGGSNKTLNRWVYDYLRRNSLSIRCVT